MKRIVGVVVAGGLILASGVGVGKVGESERSETPVWVSGSVEQAKPLRVMGGFDSISANLKGEDSYRDELTDLLPVPHTFSVTAEPGSRCLDWPSRLPELLSLHDPDVVLINCGTNDAASSPADRELLNVSYRQILDAILAHDPGTFIIASLIQISSPTAVTWLPASEVRANEIIAAVMDDYVGVYPRVGLVDFTVIEATAANNPDGVHPSLIGQQMYANIWFAEGRRLGAW